MPRHERRKPAYAPFRSRVLARARTRGDATGIGGFGALRLLDHLVGGR